METIKESISSAFNDGKHNYEAWQAAFMLSIPNISREKVTSARSVLSGEALGAIENLGHSLIAYHAAKEW